MRTRTWVVACLLLAAAISVHAETRVALVIGNSNYQHAPLLANPAHDATDVAAALRKLGYAAELVSDASKSGMEVALARFASVAIGADQALIYYSGHGLEVGGVNYLVPVDARIGSEATVPLEAVSLTTVMGIASGARHFGLVVLDACRDNPLANNLRRPDGTTRSTSRGLAAVEPTGNLLVAYATRDGHVAADGTGRNSPYTAAILEALQVQGLEVRLFWGRVHDRVVSATHRAQEPFIYGALGGEALYLNPPAPASGSNSPVTSGLGQGAVELALWQSVEKLGTAEAYRAYLTQYPKGQFSSVAKLQLAALIRPVATGGSSASPTASMSGDSPPSVGTGSTVFERRAGETFRDCADACPEMVVIPAGRFTMGAPRTETGSKGDEAPHEVRIAYALAVSKYPIIRREWKQFVAETHYKDGSDCLKGQEDNHPVVCVTWQDATAYAAWMSRKAGQHYRLLTEAEWEYAARAGTTMAYYWGSEIGSGHANCQNCGSRWDNRGTSPVGSFAQNPWGLYDMAGNVASWTLDCWINNYQGVPTDGTACKSASDPDHVLRGGSWLGFPYRLRTSYRMFSRIASNDIGFRVARDDR
jgi:formylglycine-generating enzyme required for sulfatase activity/uncharacterized caspase-like protein